MHIKNTKMFGDLAAAAGALDTPRRFPVHNPSTGELLAELPDMQASGVALAIDRADATRERWADLTARERSDILWRWHQLIVDHIDDLPLF